VAKRALTQSLRRCALCFHLHKDTQEKKGQIAHLDRRRSNSTEDNLVFLCLSHHSDYDSTTSQHKNYTIAEVKDARDALYRWVKRGMPPLLASARNTRTVKARPKMFGAPPGPTLKAPPQRVPSAPKLKYLGNHNEGWWLLTGLGGGSWKNRVFAY
jgi:hypothetical protein